MQLEERARRFQPLGVKDCDGFHGRIRPVVGSAMLGAQLRMGDAQHHMELRDEQLSHQSDTLSDKCEWQCMATSEEGVTTIVHYQNR